MKTLYKIFLLCCLISCKQKDSNGYEPSIKGTEFEIFLHSNKIEIENFKEIIIIPNVGCSGCISDAERDFIKKYKDLTRLYIFTSINDLKLFRNSLPNAALNSKNVIIDIDNKLVDLGFDSIYPSTLHKNEENTYITKRY